MRGEGRINTVNDDCNFAPASVGESESAVD